MKIYSRISLYLIFFMAFLLSACSSSGNGNDNPDLSTLSAKTAALKAALTEAGYEVKVGKPALFGLEQCAYAIATMGNCAGNNPAAPYIVFSSQPWDEEFIDEAVRNAFGPVDEGYISSHRVDPREAMVYLVEMPPEAAYFGFQTYVFTRQGALNTQDPIYQAIGALSPQARDIYFQYSPNPERVVVFSSIGNSINDKIMARDSGAAFNEQRFIIVTPDQYMDRTIRSLLAQSGVSNSTHIFTEPINSTSLRLGLDSAADDFSPLIRYAMPADESAGNQWRTNLPIMVLRVRDKNTSRAAEPYPVPVLDTRTASSELSSETDLETLVTAVKAKHGQPDATTKSMADLQDTFDMVGPDCIERPMNCLGDTQDTTYQGGFNQTIDNGQVFAIIGTLGTETGNATYVSLAVYRAADLTGVENISSGDLADTASEYAGQVTDSSQFYVYFFARDCNGLANCVSITTDLVPLGGDIRIVQRDYIRPATVRGPDSTQLLLPRVVIFNGSMM